MSLISYELIHKKKEGLIIEQRYLYFNVVQNSQKRVISLTRKKGTHIYRRFQKVKIFD